MHYQHSARVPTGRSDEPELNAVVAAASGETAAVWRPADAPDDAGVGLGDLADQPERRLACAAT